MKFKVNHELLFALRYLYEQYPKLPVIAAGSLVEFVLEEVGIPVGRIDQLIMRPVSFVEFISALGKDHLLGIIKESSFNEEIPDIVHNQLLECLRLYFYVGGMPEAFAAYLKSQDLGIVSDIHARILKGYEDDFQKYSKKSDWMSLQVVFQKAPYVVGDSRVKYVKLDRNIRGEKLKTAVELLTKAQVVSKVISSYANKPPLRSAAQSKFFKLVFLDIGLLHHSMGFDWRSLELDSDLTDVKNGVFAEQFVGQELLTTESINSSKNLFYWYRNVKGSDAEVDYLVDYKGEVAPIEVKSGSRGTLKSLQLYIEKNNNNQAFVLSQRNISKLKETSFLPLYMASRLGL